MQPSPTRLAPLGSPVFVAATALLLANDFLLKALLHNWLTGKLSDFAGLFALGFFCATLWPERRARLAAAIAAAFLYWKSPYSQPLLDWLGALLPFGPHRTVDYTDLMALPALGAGAWSSSRVKTWRLARPSAVALAVVSPFAFVATSYPPPYVVRNSAAVDLVREASAERQIEEAFDDIAERHSLDCRQCAAVTDGRVYEARGRRGLMLVASLDASSGALYYDVRASKRGREERAARELHADVRQALEGRFPEMALIGIDGWRIETVRLLVEHVDAVEARGGPDTAADEVWRIVHRASQARGLRVDEQYGRVLYAGRLLGPTVFDRELVVTAGYHAKNVHAVQLVRSSDGVEALERSLSADLERLLRAAFPAARLYVNREPGWRGR